MGQIPSLGASRGLHGGGVFSPCLIGMLLPLEIQTQLKTLAIKVNIFNFMAFVNLAEHVDCNCVEFID